MFRKGLPKGVTGRGMIDTPRQGRYDMAEDCYDREKER